MDENTYFEQGNVKVTNMRFITGRQTYAVKNVTSIKTSVQKPNRLIPSLIALVAIIMFYAIGAHGGVDAVSAVEGVDASYGVAAVEAVEAVEGVNSNIGEVTMMALLLIILPLGGLFYLQKTTYHIGLCTAGGESKALETYDLAYFNSVVEALNKAIVDRS